MELQTSVKQDNTTRTRTPKPGYLNLSNTKHEFDEKILYTSPRHTQLGAISHFNHNASHTLDLPKSLARDRA
jgi:hypothetical protein